MATEPMSCAEAAKRGQHNKAIEVSGVTACRNTESRQGVEVNLFMSDSGIGMRRVLSDDGARLIASALIGQDIEALQAVCEAAQRWVETFRHSTSHDLEGYRRASQALAQEVARLDAGQEADSDGE